MRLFLFLLGLVLLIFVPVRAQNSFTFALNLADSRITDFRGPCYVHREPIYHHQELVLFLPGKNYQPNFYADFIVQAGKLGYHAIALKYVDNEPLEIQAACGASADPDCFVNARLEGLTGEDLSSQVNISRINSIEHRLIVALKYLNQTFPGNGWNKFWTGDSTLSWSQFRVIGHEEGAGYAAAIGKEYEVARVVMMGWADWNTNSNSAAAWLATAKATPGSRWYGFAHEQDERVALERQTATWEALGLNTFGAVQNVLSVAHPYSNSHRLVTNATPAQSPGAFNDAVVVSAFTPRTGGEPSFLDAWSYLISGSTKVSVEDGFGALSLKTYPNPATDILQVEGQWRMVPANVKIIGMDGRSWQLPFQTVGPDRITLSVADLPSGVYLLQLDESNPIRFIKS